MEVNKSRLNFRVPPEKFEDIKWVIRNHNSRTGNTLAKEKKIQNNYIQELDRQLNMNANPSEIREPTEALRNSKQFLLHY
jgi:hypothetical protein